jgi:membrane-associated protease RseP (regulator of RpoE activity)
MNGFSLRVAFFLILVGAFSCVVVHGEEEAATETPKAASAEEIATWIKALDGPQYREREEATQRLLTAGKAALDPLLKVANSDQPEPADRAIWILRNMGRSADNSLALSALEHVVQLRNRPAIVSKAEVELTNRSVTACAERLEPLGADVSMRIENIESGPMPFLTVELGDKWHGTLDDLRQLIKMQRILRFRLQGAPVSDDIVKMFAEKQTLANLMLIETKVTPDAVDYVKEKHPDTAVYVRNLVKLGVSAEKSPAGMVVNIVQPDTAAANANMAVGDIIVTIDGHPVPDFDRLTARIAQHQPGEQVELEIIRKELVKDKPPVEKRMKIQPVLGTWPDRD